MSVCTKLEGVQYSLAAEVNHAPGSYVYTMGVLYEEISTWPTKQVVDLQRRLVVINLWLIGH